MWRMIGVIVLSGSVFLCTALALNLTESKKITLVIQQASNPAMTSLSFNKGFAELLTRLPPDCRVKLI